MRSGVGATTEISTAASLAVVPHPEYSAALDCSHDLTTLHRRLQQMWQWVNQSDIQRAAESALLDEYRKKISMLNSALRSVANTALAAVGSGGAAIADTATVPVAGANSVVAPHNPVLHGDCLRVERIKVPC